MKTIKLTCGEDFPKYYTGIIEWNTGTISYYLNGFYHREGGDPAIIYPNGEKIYYVNGKLHREDGPAVTYSNSRNTYPNSRKEYFINGKLHREDGPAIIYSDGRMYYFLNDKEITKEVNIWIKENNIPEIWNNSYKILFKLTFV